MAVYNLTTAWAEVDLTTPRLRHMHTGATAYKQVDGSYIPSSACECGPPGVNTPMGQSVTCPIDYHAQQARQATWAFDDNGVIYCED